MTTLYLPADVRYLHPLTRTDLRASIYHHAWRGRAPFVDIVKHLQVNVMPRPQLHAINGRPC